MISLKPVLTQGHAPYQLAFESTQLSLQLYKIKFWDWLTQDVLASSLNDLEKKEIGSIHGNYEDSDH